MQKQRQQHNVSMSHMLLNWLFRFLILYSLFFRPLLIQNSRNTGINYLHGNIHQSTPASMEARDETLRGKSKGKVHPLDSHKQVECSQDKMNSTGTFLSRSIFSQLMSPSGASITYFGSEHILKSLFPLTNRHSER